MASVASDSTRASEPLETGQNAPEDGAAGFVDPRPRILAAALRHVEREGWSQEALAAGARDCGFPSVAQGMFPRGAVELVHDFMRRCSVAMSVRLESTDLASLSVNERIATAVRYRLEALAPHIRSWPQAMAMGALPQNLPDTVTILTEAVDEMWWHAGDRSTDLSWYSRRALLLGVYAATETFMLTDRSSGFVDTWAFLDRRLADASALGQRAGESLAVAQATAGGAASIALAALEIFRPAIVAGGAVMGAGISAAEAAVSGIVQRAGAGTAGAAGTAGSSTSGGSSTSTGPGMDINIAGIPLGTIMSAAAPLAPVASAAVAAVEGISRSLGVPLPPMVQVLMTAVAAPAAGAAPSFTGPSSSSSSAAAAGGSVGAGGFPLPPLPNLSNITSTVSSGLQSLAGAAAAPGSPLASLAGVGNSPWVQVRGGRAVGETYRDADVRPQAQAAAPATAAPSRAGATPAGVGASSTASVAPTPAISPEAVAAAAGLRSPAASGPRLS